MENAAELNETLVSSLTFMRHALHLHSTSYHG